MEDLLALRAEIDAIDAEMAPLFERRMQAAAQVAAYKRKHGLPVLDAAREEQVLQRATERIQNELLQPYYKEYMQHLMTLSRQYQQTLLQQEHSVF